MGSVPTGGARAVYSRLALAGSTIALLTGLVTLANVIGGAWWPGLDQTIVWLDLRWLPADMAAGIIATTALTFVGFGIAGRRAPVLGIIAAVAASVLLILSLRDMVAVVALRWSGRVAIGSPVPASLMVVVTMVFVIAGGVAGRRETKDRRTLLLTRSLAAMLVILFPLVHMICFGQTDYRRPAPAAVVFGAAVWPGGKPSPALYDRVMTGVELYQQGLVQKLIMSGGEGRDGVHETEAMQAIAMQAGVPEEAIILDKGGVNTRKTVEHLAQLMDTLDMGSVLAVSHFYHLSRIKMACTQEGIQVYTVPAKEQFPQRKLPWYMAREVVAWWAYFLEPYMGFVGLG